jgi:predicted RNase H-like HicB family nuclease
LSRKKASRSLAPDYPACWSQGATEAEALENIRDAIREYLAAVAQSLPESNMRDVEVSI